MTVPLAGSLAALSLFALSRRSDEFTIGHPIEPQ